MSGMRSLTGVWAWFGQVYCLGQDRRSLTERILYFLTSVLELMTTSFFPNCDRLLSESFQRVISTECQMHRAMMLTIIL